jgi:hypothetical protein
MAAARVQEAVNTVIRREYRLVYLLLRAWWFVRRPHTRGAAVALWHRGQVLLVRASNRTQRGSQAFYKT